MDLIKKNLKWIGTVLVFMGILLMYLNIYPLNIFFHGPGILAWTIHGYIYKDKAVLTNFALQIPFSLGNLFGLEELDVEFVNSVTTNHKF